MEKKVSVYKLICVFILIIALSFGYFALMRIRINTESNDFYLGMLLIASFFVVTLSLHLMFMQKQKSLRNYLNLYLSWFKYIWMAFVFIGICLIAFNPNLNFWKGIGAALFLDSALMLFADFYGNTIINK